MKTIVRRSAAIVTFLGLVGVSLHAPQLRHLERFADLLVIAPRRKTLAQLAEQELDGVDASNLADFFRISPWDPDDIRLPILEFILGYLKQHPELLLVPIYFTLDDSLTPKDKGTRKLQGVDWHFDHNQKRTIKGGCHVVLGIHWGDFHFPLSWRLYLRESTVRRLNKDKSRRGKPRLHYRSKLQLAQEMLQQVIPFLPATSPVYVLFDSWYTSAKLVKWIRQQGWHVIGAIKSNRKLSGQKLTDRHRALKGRSYDRVSLELANKQRRTYWTRTLTGRLRNVPGEVRVVISQRGPGVRAPKYFLCTDTTLSAQEILTRYQKRWSQEVDYWYVKLQLGLGDFRLHSYEAIAKWFAVVYLVLVYLYWQQYEHTAHHGASSSLSEVLARIRQDHQREVLRAACEEVARGATVEEVVERYVGPPTAAAA
jgi:hypothetical protein